MKIYRKNRKYIKLIKLQFMTLRSSVDTHIEKCKKNHKGYTSSIYAATFKPSITRCCAECGMLTLCLVAVAVYVSAAVATGTSTIRYTTTTTLSTTTASTPSTTDNGM